MGILLMLEFMSAILEQVLAMCADQIAQGRWLQKQYQCVLMQVMAVWTCPKHVRMARKIVYIGNV